MKKRSSRIIRRTLPRSYDTSSRRRIFVSSPSFSVVACLLGPTGEMMNLHRDDDSLVVHDALADVAAMTNHELFTAVIARVRRCIAIEGRGRCKRKRKKGGRGKKNRNKNKNRGNDDDDDDDDDGDDDDDDDDDGGDGEARGAVDNHRWRRVAISIATSAAYGEVGCRTPDEWSARSTSFLRKLCDCGDDRDGVGDGTSERGRNKRDVEVVPGGCHRATITTDADASADDFGHALRSLDEGGCYRSRLRNALDALDDSSSSSSSSSSSLTRNDDDDSGGMCLSVRRAVGLTRCVALLLYNLNVGGGGGGGGGGACEESPVCRGGWDGADRSLIKRALAHLHRSIRASSGSRCAPLRDILLAVQSPLLRKLDRDGTFAEGGGRSIIESSFLSSSSLDAEVAEFRHLLGLDFDAAAMDDDSALVGGKKRKHDNRGEGVHEEDGTRCTDDDVIPRLLEAAHLARKGAVRAQHGAVIYVPSYGDEDDDEGEGKATKKSIVIGRGWNHDYLLDQSPSGRKNKIVLHSEVHAIADAICNYGEDECFEKLFPRATIMIVELVSDYAYDTCHPCPKCDPLLRAVGISTVLHTTPHGRIEELDLRPANAALLTNENVSIPLNAACLDDHRHCEGVQLAIAKEGILDGRAILFVEIALKLVECGCRSSSLGYFCTPVLIGMRHR
ncbi:hypothetical protein ACHAXA_003262 [Cyclostephanos tholiformis]|uniref:CMP/dCMP-type deaminase domain-containing protein n=1 Tax=Cyclostephanos tholiformis TaxID=382380 RepID=A0ABD3SB13_9STRA